MLHEILRISAGVSFGKNLREKTGLVSFATSGITRPGGFGGTNVLWDCWSATGLQSWGTSLNVEVPLATSGTTRPDEFWCAKNVLWGCWLATCHQSWASANHVAVSLTTSGTTRPGGFGDTNVLWGCGLATAPQSLASAVHSGWSPPLVLAVVRIVARQIYMYSTYCIIHVLCMYICTLLVYLRTRLVAQGQTQACFTACVSVQTVLCGCRQSPGLVQSCGTKGQKLNLETIAIEIKNIKTNLIAILDTRCTTHKFELEKWSTWDHAATKFRRTSFLKVTEYKVNPLSILIFQPKLRKLLQYITVSPKNVFQLVFHLKKLMLCGDIESNPGPATYQQHRMSCNRFYSIALKTGQKTCLQQFLGMNSGQFYHWKKMNLSCPKTSLQKFFCKMQRMKCRNQLFMNSSSKVFIKEATINASVSIRLADEKLNIKLVRATPDYVKFTSIVFERYDMYSTEEKRTDDLIWNSCKKKTTGSKILMDQRRHGYEIIHNDYLYLVNPHYFNPRFPAPLNTSSLGNLNSVKLFGGGDDENKTPKSSGRKPKRKGFRGNNIAPVVSTPVLPKKLQNNIVIGQGLENTCFCNAALQVLFSLPKYTNFINSSNYPAGSIGAIIKELCTEFCSQQDMPINTLQYLTRLELPEYTPYQQLRAFHPHFR